jgi:hypothetical protein
VVTGAKISAMAFEWHIFLSILIRNPSIDQTYLTCGSTIYNMLRKTLKWTGIILAVALIGMQFYHPAKNINPVTGPNDIIAAYGVPENVTTTLHKACYDCHSNNTNYPWYNNIQPVAMFLADHVKEGKEELNFSEFGSFSPKRKLKKLKEIIKEVEGNEMPLDSYTWIHNEAVLTPEEKQALIEWAKGLSLKLSMELPAVPQ